MVMSTSSLTLPMYYVAVKSVGRISVESGYADISEDTMIGRSNLLLQGALMSVLHVHRV